MRIIAHHHHDRHQLLIWILGPLQVPLLAAQCNQTVRETHREAAVHTVIHCRRLWSSKTNNTGMKTNANLDECLWECLSTRRGEGALFLLYPHTHSMQSGCQGRFSRATRLPHPLNHRIALTSSTHSIPEDTEKLKSHSIQYSFISSRSSFRTSPSDINLSLGYVDKSLRMQLCISFPSQPEPQLDCWMAAQLQTRDKHRRVFIPFQTISRNSRQIYLMHSSQEERSWGESPLPQSVIASTAVRTQKKWMTWQISEIGLHRHLVGCCAFKELAVILIHCLVLLLVGRAWEASCHPRLLMLCNWSVVVDSMTM